MSHSDADIQALRETASELFPDRMPDSGEVQDDDYAVALFNDHPRTTHADVLLVLEKAAIKRDEVLG